MSWFRQGEVRQSFADAREALAAAERNGRPVPVSQRLLGLADGHTALGERAEARAVLLRGEALLRETGDRQLLALTRTRLGSLTEDLAEAERRHRQALAPHAVISGAPNRTVRGWRWRPASDGPVVRGGGARNGPEELRTALAVERAAEHPQLQGLLRTALAELDGE
ncbi:hypothetical protein NKH77_00985 [Streptomyces sp. M19]